MPILAARRQLIEVRRISLYTQIRGLLKAFGVVLGPGAGGTFERAVKAECPDDPLVRDVVGAVLSAWKVAAASPTTRDGDTLPAVLAAADEAPLKSVVAGLRRG